MKQSEIFNRLPTILRKNLYIFCLIAYIVFAGLLFRYSYPSRIYSEEGLIRDLIWLDAWGLSFAAVFIIIWIAPITRRIKFLLSLFSLSLFAFISTNLIFAGTPFGMNAFWGDQKFRIAMIEKFLAFGWGVDYYYKDLPAFYPPLYYFVLSLYAKVFSLEAFKMVKVGSLLTFSLLPLALYLFWKKVVSSYQAFFISIGVVVFCGIEFHYQFYSPHAFIANVFFIPWWLYYIERIKSPPDNWQFYVTGSLIGGIIFMIFFYPFFLGVFLIILRLLFARNLNIAKYFKTFSLWRTFAVFIGSVVVSAPYWIPAVFSVFRNGIDRSRGGWHHIGSPGLNYDFFNISLLGLLFLAALIYVLSRYRNPVYRSLSLLFGAAIVFHLVASIFGGLGLSLNLAKMMHFVNMSAGVFSGLFLSSLIRAEKYGNRQRNYVSVLAVFLLLFSINEFTSIIKHPRVKTARTSEVPSWNLEPDETEKLKGSVFWAPPELFAFKPVFAFISQNEHYSNPAARFKERYDFLSHLQEIDDPYIFNIALRYNRYDAIDHVMLNKKDEYYEYHVSLSNYPNKHVHKYLRYHQEVFDLSLFALNRHKLNLFSPKKEISNYVSSISIPKNSEDSIRYLAQVYNLSTYLNPEGAALIKRHINNNFSSWSDNYMGDDAILFDKKIELQASYLAESKDSLYFVNIFQPHEDININYRIFLHIYPDDSTMLNFDFSPHLKSISWKAWENILTIRALPKTAKGHKFIMGFFTKEERLEGVFQGRLN